MYLLTRLFPRMALVALITGSALLTGCLESAGDSASNVNSFPQGDGTGLGFSDSSSGSVTNESNLDQNQIRVSVQVPKGVAEGEAGRRNLLTTTNADLAVTRVNADLQTVATLNPRIKTEDNAFVLTFRGRSQAPSDIDLIVTATVGSNTYQAPLAAGSRHVRLNPFTDYLVHRVIGDELDSTDISNLKGCSDSLCPQALVWSPLVDQVQNFEIDIPSNSSAGQARSFLENRADFADFVAQATRALKLDEERIGSLEGSVDTSTTSFNTVYYGTSLNLDRTENTPFWATRTISRGETVSNGGVGFAYPSLTLTSFALDLLDLNVTSLASDVPYIRNSAGFSDLDGITNTHATSPGPAFIRDEQSLIASRPVFQSITRQGDRTTGWAPDPHFLAGYLLGETNDPTALLSSYFHAGKTLSLTSTGDEKFKRNQTLEDQATSALEVNLPQWGDDDGNSVSPESDYNMIGFEVVPAQNGSPAMVRATLGEWTVSGGGDSFGADEDTTVNDGIVWEMTNTAVSGSTSGTENPYEDSFEISPIDIRFSSDDSFDFKGHAFYNHPDVVIQDAGLSEPKPNGAVSPDHRWMAFSARSGSGSDTGDFIRIAHHHNSEDIRDGDAYRLVGYDITLDGDKEQLEQLNGSCLVAGSSDTVLVERGLRVSRTLSSTGSYTAPEAFENPDLELNSISANAGRFTISNSGTVIKGFVADKGNTLVMLKKTGQSLGILLGFREDSPAGCPSN